MLKGVPTIVGIKQDGGARIPKNFGIKYVVHGLVEGWQPLMETDFF
jgi:hypothetical protein